MPKDNLTSDPVSKSQAKRSPRREYALAIRALGNAKSQLLTAERDLQYARRRVAEALTACNEQAWARQKR